MRDRCRRSREFCFPPSSYVHVLSTGGPCPHVTCTEAGFRGDSFLGRVDPATRQALSTHGCAERYGDGDVVMAQGAAGGSVGVLLDGLVKVSCTDSDGHMAILSIRGAGDVIGL